MAAKKDREIKKLKSQFKKLTARIDDMNSKIEALLGTVSETGTRGASASVIPGAAGKTDQYVAEEPSRPVGITEEMVEQSADMDDSAEEAEELLENIESEATEASVLSGEIVEAAEEVAEAAEEAEEMLEEAKHKV